MSKEMKRLSRRKAITVVAGATCATFGLSSYARADTHILTATDAGRMLAAGDLVVLDIRTREEWQETGIAAGAWPVSMHEPDFGERLVEILQIYSPDQIALICRTGNRSNYVRAQIAAQGIRGLRDVAEGMMGNGQAPGWMARGLPIVTLHDAEAAYESSRTEWAAK